MQTTLTSTPAIQVRLTDYEQIIAIFQGNYLPDNGVVCLKIPNPAFSQCENPNS